MNILFKSSISYLGLIFLMFHGHTTVASGKDTQQRHDKTVDTSVENQKKHSGTKKTDNDTESARSPHAYSGGYALTEGPYLTSDKKRLVLADEYKFGSLLINQLETAPEEDTSQFDIQAWYGTTYNRLVLKSEGTFAKSELEESSSELLWGHAISTYFDSQLGIRFDTFDSGENRQWLAFGIQGLAPYWFEVGATAYLGDEGRTALRLDAEYELFLSQRLILQPSMELSFFGKDDPVNAIGKGLSDASFGVRLRYEFDRQFAPYMGVEWSKKFGNSADFARLEGESVSDWQWVIGIRAWF